MKWSKIIDVVRSQGRSLSRSASRRDVEGADVEDMVRPAARQLCPYCDARFGPDATACPGCGAVRVITRPSPVQLFILYPLIALGIAIALWAAAGVHPITAGLVLLLTWIGLGAAHVTYRRNYPRW